MDLRHISRVLTRSIAVVIGVPIVASAGAGIYAAAQTRIYEASTSVYVATSQAATASDLNAGGIYTQQVVKSYADLAAKPIVLNRVIADLRLDTTATKLARQVTVKAPINTTVLDITADDPDPRRAAQIADSMAAAIRDVVPKLSPATGASATVKVTSVGSADIPTSPVSPKPVLWALLALLGGLAVGVGIAFLREALDQRIRSSRDVLLVTDRPVIGHLLRNSDSAVRPLVVADDPRGPGAEAFRTLRTNLQFFDFGGQSRSMVVTSPSEGEGKSTAAANLAIAMTDAGDHVVLIEADLRRPKVTRYLGVDRSIGLTDVLLGRVGVSQAIQTWGTAGLAVLPSGPLPPNPSELLQSAAMVDLLQELELRYDVIIIDAPPLLPVSDAAILARRTAGALLVTSARRTTRAQLQSSINKLEQVGARVLGVVMSMLPEKGVEVDEYEARAYGSDLEQSATPVAAPAVL